ncbi:MAG: hydrogenase formation protein HypD, partial [Candidatus Sumerlaeota bacterium]
MTNLGMVQQQIQVIQSLLENTSRVRIMEVCGTHTVSLFRSGIRSLLPKGLTLISGPGCPVCVTSQGYIDAACELASRDDVIIATYGDMVRVPGRGGSLAKRRAEGGWVEVVYSVRDALRIARENPEKKVVFLAVGFETTAPATAAALDEANASNLNNFSILPGHKRVMPAMEALVADADVPLDGFLCPGHVSVILGTRVYEPLARDSGKPCVIAGFEPPIMLEAIE